MLYNNLIYFLVVIFVFSTKDATATPWLPPFATLGCLVGLLSLFSWLARRIYSRRRAGRSLDYFAAERTLTILGVALFTVMVYGLDLKYYLHGLSWGDRLPVLENLAGLSLFFLLLSLAWIQARESYQQLFHRHYTPSGFVLTNIRTNLPIVLPWVVLSLVFDLLTLLPVSAIQEVLLSPWGDLLLFAVFVTFLMIFFPPLVRRLWNCRPMPQGPVLSRIQDFCRQQDFHAEVLYWPLFEGQVLTAGVMGIIPRLRYLLITPALLEALDEAELDSVLAHEIGHVKKKHMILYVLLFLGFSLLAGSLATPVPHLILASDSYYRILAWADMSPESLLALLGAIPLLVLLLVYFRFIFGYFIRNFERQADAFVFSAQESGRPLISSFEKIARLSGTRRQEKNWHHFGIGERIEFLERCELDRGEIRRQDRKVYCSLACYFLAILALVFTVQRVDLQALSHGYELRYAEAVLLQKARQEPGNSVWPMLLADLMQSKKMEKEAIAAYEQVLAIKPSSAEVNNNLAWLLLTASDVAVRDPQRALTLARTAALVRREGFIFDTLATAFWANGLVEEALLHEAKAIKVDPDNRRYYLQQMERFKTRVWGKEPGPESEQQG
ncbi:M48 family metallopeptidase [Desulfogranum mediterraneum]|uniref:M48 family metallopeptidase n=1 Tax=Desulfogranum mediterraneum TaxID=160661 RepID=UPI00040C11E4|nr:M48 family metallopeptidase [Desulfogranum mediterraneum]